MQDFKNLLVWKKAHELALLTYKITVNSHNESDPS